jgi:heme oxygenase
MSSITQRLQQETAELQQGLESQIPLFGPLLTPSLYQTTLASFWGFYATWEQLALDSAPPALVGIVRAREKLHLIEADLLALTHTAGVLFKLRRDAMDPGWLPDLRLPANLLGSMYVIESFTLSAVIISRSLESELLMAYGWGYSFFLGYGADTGLRWNTFCSILDRAPHEDGDTIVAAAQQTFAAFRRWLSHRNGFEDGKHRGAGNRIEPS